MKDVYHTKKQVQKEKNSREVVDYQETSDDIVIKKLYED